MGTDSASMDLLLRVLAGDRPVVVDADALTLAAAHSEVMEALRRADAVVTPHPGEAERMVPGLPGDRMEALAVLREETEAVVLLKGMPSLVSGPLGRWISGVGTSDLAAAGMGDTLTGVVGSLLAQGAALQTAAGLGLVFTGRAAERAGGRAGLQTADVPEHLPGALEEGAGVPGTMLAGVLLDLDAPR